MTIFFWVLLIFWIVVSIKQILFWVYLWQLKEYHIPRFLDHFRTAKGKQIIFNKLRFLKIILFVLLFVSFTNSFAPPAGRQEMVSGYFVFLNFSLLFLYIFETIVFAKQIVKNSFKKPVFTGKTLFLLLICFVIIYWVVFFIFYDIKFPVYILLLDIFLPIVVSIVVLLFQPFAVMARNRILRKAKIKWKFSKI